MSSLLEDIERAIGLMNVANGKPSVSTGLLSGSASFGAMRFFADDPYNNFAAMRIYGDPSMVEQFRFPRSKGKRIRLKWKKNPKNSRPSRHALVDQRRGNIYCHPVMCEEIRRQILKAR